jgi:hypothetical protein
MTDFSSPMKSKICLKRRQPNCLIWVFRRRVPVGKSPSVQPGVVDPGLSHDRKIRIRALPESKEIFMSRFGTAVTLQSGESASLAINGNTLTSVSGARVQVLPTVAPVAGIVNACQASAEIFDNALGITNVLVPGAVGYPPNPALGMLGVTELETVRLNVVAYPADPCVGQISFLNSNGALVGNALMNVNLGPGQAIFLDLPGNTLVSKLGQRAEVRPVVTPVSASNAPNSCIPSAEVYINGLGSTSS